MRDSITRPPAAAETAPGADLAAAAPRGGASEPSPLSAPRSARGRRRIGLCREGLLVGGEVVPLHAGSVHYWRLDPRDWRACLRATRDLGLRLVDVYVPWSVHEIAPGRFELGEADPRRDVGGFLRLAHELGLLAIVRPGPHVNAELTHFGIPARVVWDPGCQARSPRGRPVMLPMVPVAFPVPSYASHAFHDEVARWFQAIGAHLAPLRWPEGPIVLCQIDNEGALYFRDGAYDQDYHPDAIQLYRSFLREKYRRVEELCAAYARDDEDDPEELTFARVVPPDRFDLESTRGAARHLDWCEFHEHLLAASLERFARELASAGLDELPTVHNFPFGQETTPLNAPRIERGVDFVGLDYYHAASPRDRAVIARRTSELAVRSAGRDVPTFASEMGAGFPPFFPPLGERDSAFTALCALAYGLRGFNVYMAVERDRWIGAPIDARGRMRAFAGFWRRLTAALETTRFWTLRRRTPVRLVMPRSQRRLARAMHAFGPLTGAFFAVLGAGAQESTLEDDLGLGYPVAIEADGFFRAVEQALEARGVPFASVGGEDRAMVLDGASWIVCASSGMLHPVLLEHLRALSLGGTRVSIGPRAPRLDGTMRPLERPLGQEEGDHRIELIPADPASIDAAVARSIEALGLPTFASDPAGVHVTVHEDEAGVPRVVFVIHPGGEDVLAKVAVAGVREVTDLLDATRHAAPDGVLELRCRPRSVRMLAVG